MTRLLFGIVACLLVAGCGESKIEEPAKKPETPEPAVEEPTPTAAEPKPVGQGGEGAEVADVILIVPLGGTKKSVSFPHKMHADPALNPVVDGKCDKCHHEAKDGAVEQKCTASGCHDDSTEDIPKAMDSFHKTCRDGCHKAIRETDPSNAKLLKLKACKGCHAH
jgi:hypothetical protein